MNMYCMSNTSELSRPTREPSTVILCSPTLCFLKVQEEGVGRTGEIVLSASDDKVTHVVLFSELLR